MLGKSYGAALTEGEIELRFDAASGAFDFWYADHRLPVSPRDYSTILGQIAHTPALSRPLDALQEAFLSEAAPRYLRRIAGTAKEALSIVARERAIRHEIEDTAASWHGSRGDFPSWTRLHELLQRQCFRLAHWRAAADEVNYRRFFDIQDLAGMRMERIVVFRDTHEFLGRMLADGILQGLRIDHVDGLADPQRYCRRLNAFAAAIVPRDGNGKRLRPYILVEKILTGTEELPRSWPVSGTTGYDYLALANGLFIEPTGLAKLQRHWRRFAGIDGDSTIEEEIYRCRLLVIDRHLASELTYLVNWLVEIGEADWFTRDFTRKRLRDALVEIVAAFSVYRTYVTERGISDEDRRIIAEARGQGAWPLGRRGRRNPRFHRLAADARHPYPQSRPLRRQARSDPALRRALPAIHRSDRRQGGRGYVLLPLRAARVGERSRRVALSADHDAELVSRTQRRARRGLAAGDARFRHARHQARRGYARASRRAERDSRRVGAAGRALASL